MSDRRLDVLMESFSELCGQAILNEEYQKAILLGALGYALFDEEGDANFSKAALGFVTDSIARIDPETVPSQIPAPTREQVACSFCGRSPPEIKLASGPDAFICDSCVRTLSDRFSMHDDDPT